MIRLTPISTLFPYTTLFRSRIVEGDLNAAIHLVANEPIRIGQINLGQHCAGRGVFRLCNSRPKDRKSTRLNSSHVEISYAVFCLKKKRKEYLKSSSAIKFYI